MRVSPGNTNLLVQIEISKVRESEVGKYLHTGRHKHCQEN